MSAVRSERVTDPKFGSVKFGNCAQTDLRIPDHRVSSKNRTARTAQRRASPAGLVAAGKVATCDFFLGFPPKIPWLSRKKRQNRKTLPRSLAKRVARPSFAPLGLGPQAAVAAVRLPVRLSPLSAAVVQAAWLYSSNSSRNLAPKISRCRDVEMARSPNRKREISPNRFPTAVRAVVCPPLLSLSSTSLPAVCLHHCDSLSRRAA